MKVARLTAAIGVAALAAPGIALADSGAGHGHGRADAPGQLGLRGSQGRPGNPGSAVPSPPPTSTAVGDDHGTNPPGSIRLRRGANLLFKGTIAAENAATDTVTLTVTGGNRFARVNKGKSLTFGLTTARIVAADINGDGVAGQFNDLRVGDRVVAHVRLAPGAAATQPLIAFMFVDQSALPSAKTEMRG
jgi:hypothetical protein